MKFGSLFTGIGGLDLGLERAGWQCAWQVEIDPFARDILARHWPNVARHDDIRTMRKGLIANDGIDALAGGFPCQDISQTNFAGKGITGPRSGLWSEYLRLIRDFDPKIVVIENVSAITFRGLGTVLRDLSRSGRDAEWQVVPASILGAPHARKRLFIVAYPARKRRAAHEVFKSKPCQTLGEKRESRLWNWPGQLESSAARHDRIRWVPDSQVCRVANGIPDRLDRYRVLGNSVSPVVGEWIGQQINNYLKRV